MSAYRNSDRALCRSLSHLAGAGAGKGAAYFGEVPGLWRKGALRLKAAGIRAELDVRSEKIGYKIREAQSLKIPYMLVVGAREEEQGLVAVRSRFGGDEGQSALEDFIQAVKEEIASKEIKKTEAETK